jgi:hypothetical protein
MRHYATAGQSGVDVQMMEFVVLYLRSCAF